MTKPATEMTKQATPKSDLPPDIGKPPLKPDRPGSLPIEPADKPPSSEAWNLMVDVVLQMSAIHKAQGQHYDANLLEKLAATKSK